MKNRKCFCIILLIVAVFILFGMPVNASGPDQPELSVPTAAAVDSPKAGDYPPEVSAQCAILMDTNGTVLLQKNAGMRMSPASTTKIMTALTVLRSCSDLDVSVKIPKEAVGVEGSSVYLYENEELTLRQLLYAMLMESANDAAAAIACYVGGSVAQFADMMNETAAAIGLTDSHFVNPHGLDDDQHYTTARDLAEIARQAMTNADFRAMVSTYKMEIPLKGSEGIRLLINHNKLLKTCDGCIGVKTGYTKKSGRCLVSAAERNGCTLICVTLNAPDDWNDHSALFDWGFAQIECILLSEAGEQYAVLPVVGAVTDNKKNSDGTSDDIATAAVRNDRKLTAVVMKNNQNIKKTVILPRFLYAPVKKGDIVGHVVYYNNDVEIGRLNLYACEDVALYEKPSLWERIRMLFTKKQG